MPRMLKQLSLPRIYHLALLTCLIVLVIFAPIMATNISAATPTPPKPVPAQYQPLVAKAQSTGSVRVIVGLSTAFQPEGTLSNQAVRSQQAAIAQSRSQLISSLAAYNATALRTDWLIPFVPLKVDAAAMQYLATSPQVTSIQEDVPETANDLSSNNVIGTPAAWAAGYTGAGWTVAVLDTGVQSTHPFLAGKVVSEACYSTTDAGSSSTSVCPNGLSSQVGTGAGVNCNLSISGCEHGTHVAGIAAGLGGGSTGVTYSGVAKDATVIAVQVFSNFSGNAASFVSDQISGLNQVYALRSSFSIASVNMSLGGSSTFATNCDSAQAARKAAIDQLRAVNIATVIASGNSGVTNGISAPACISSSISVGATDDADNVASFSNSAPILTLLAPGVSVDSSIPPSTYANFQGTSMATPHVAGAWAVLKQRSPGATVDTILSALQSKGVAVTDSRNSIVKKRIQLDAALTAFGPVDAIGIFRPSSGTFYLRNSNTTGNADISATFGASSDLPVAGDWNGDGIDTIGVYRSSTGQFFLTNSNATGAAVVYSFTLGAPGDLPMVGDWDGNGSDGVGVFRPSNGLIYLKNALTTGFADFQMVLGSPGDIGLAGDWDGNGIDSPGVYRPSTATFFLTNAVANGSAVANYTATLGVSGDSPFAGDWNGDGSGGIGVFRPSNGLIYLKNVPTTGFADITIVFGIANDKPIAGHWSAQTASPNPVTAPKLAPTFVP